MKKMTQERKKQRKEEGEKRRGEISIRQRLLSHLYDAVEERGKVTKGRRKVREKKGGVGEGKEGGPGSRSPGVASEESRRGHKTALKICSFYWGEQRGKPRERMKK